MMSRIIRVEKAKYDGTIQAAWDSELLDHAGALLRSVVPGGETSVRAGPEPLGQERTDYLRRGACTSRIAGTTSGTSATTRRSCGTATWPCPPVSTGRRSAGLTWTLIFAATADGAPEVLDEDEFEQHRVELGYPADVCRTGIGRA